MPSKNLAALIAVTKLLADAANDFQVNGKTAATFENLIPDVIALMPLLSDIPTEAKGLAIADYEALLAQLVTDLMIANAKAKAYVDAALLFLTGAMPGVTALITASKTA